MCITSIFIIQRIAMILLFEKLGIGMLTFPSIDVIIVSRFGIIIITEPNRPIRVLLGPSTVNHTSKSNYDSS